MFPVSSTSSLLHKAVHYGFAVVIGSMLSIGVSHAQAPTEAGKVLLAIGDVKVTRGAQTLPLIKGASLQAGDGVVTGVASNAQLRMSDGAVIALRAQTEFKINQYNFNGKADGSEKANLSLVKGGVRAVTGAIGRENKDNLQINAVVATVGIRGTGFNINVCEGNCFKPDKTPVKDGLYAGVFEGKIIVTNQASTEAVGVNQYLYVADKDTKAQFILAPPNFLPDPLTGQKSAKPKGKSEAATDIPSLAVAVSAPAKAADAQVPTPTSPLPNVTGVTITQPPALASDSSPFTPSVTYNDPALGDGQPARSTSGPYGLYLQKAETNPGVNDPADGLPVRSIVPSSNPSCQSPSCDPSVVGTQQNKMQALTTGSGVSTSVYQINLQSPPYYVEGTTIPVQYAIQPGAVGSATQQEGGNYQSIVSWGRWANGNIFQIGGYNDGQPVAMPAGNGFHYIVGERTLPANLGTNQATINFALVGATTPTPVGANLGSWSVTSGNLVANFASAQISGNLGLYNTQPAGYGIYNMSFSGSSMSPTNASNTVSTNVLKTAGTLGACAGGCAGSGNVTFYGNNPGPQAAGLAYNFNTGGNVVQGVAVFKK